RVPSTTLYRSELVAGRRAGRPDGLLAGLGQLDVVQIAQALRVDVQLEQPSGSGDPGPDRAAGVGAVERLPGQLVQRAGEPGRPAVHLAQQGGEVALPA